MRETHDDIVDSPEAGMDSKRPWSKPMVRNVMLTDVRSGGGRGTDEIEYANSGPLGTGYYVATS